MAIQLTLKPRKIKRIKLMIFHKKVLQKEIKRCKLASNVVKKLLISISPTSLENLRNSMSVINTNINL